MLNMVSLAVITLLVQFCPSMTSKVCAAGDQAADGTCHESSSPEPRRGSQMLQAKVRTAAFKQNESARVAAVAEYASKYSAQHDPSACRESGNSDHDCCALPSDASCVDGYVRVMSGTKCIFNYEEYMCIPIMTDKSACLENGKYDDDCCAKPDEGTCKAGYTKVMSGTYCSLGWLQQYHEYTCYDDKVAPSAVPHPDACLENGDHDSDCCAKPEEASCLPGYTLDFSDTYCGLLGGTYMRYSCYPDGGAPQEPPVMPGGQACAQLCVMEYAYKCGGKDVGPGTAKYVKDREGCAGYYTGKNDGTLTPCVVKDGQCKKSTVPQSQCKSYTSSGDLASFCKSAGASGEVYPWSLYQ